MGFYSDHKVAVWALVGLSAACALVLVVVLPMSFSTVEYHEFGFVRQRSTGFVDTSTVYKGGKYLLGPDFEFKIFKADAHMLDLNNIAIFTADKLEVWITAHIQYFIREDELHLLHEKYDLFYEDVMKTSATDALKGAIPVYNTKELVSKRKEVEEVVFKAIRQRLGGTCCRNNCEEYRFACTDECTPHETCKDEDKGLNVNVKYFQLTNINIPNEVESRYLEALVLQEKGLREQLLQNASVIRKETSAKVKLIKNNATEIKLIAQAQANAIRSVARAYLTSTKESARAAGLKQLYNDINNTDQAHKSSFDYLRALQDHPKARLTVDFDQRIAGNL